MWVNHVLSLIQDYQAWFTVFVGIPVSILTFIWLKPQQDTLTNFGFFWRFLMAILSGIMAQIVIGVVLYTLAVTFHPGYVPVNTASYLKKSQFSNSGKKITAISPRVYSRS